MSDYVRSWTYRKLSHCWSIIDYLITLLEGARMKEYLVIVRRRANDEIVERAEFDALPQAAAFMETKPNVEFKVDLLCESDAAQKRQWQPSS